MSNYIMQYHLMPFSVVYDRTFEFLFIFMEIVDWR